MRKIIFFVVMQIVAFFASAQNFNQKLLKDCADEMNLLYSLLSTDEMQVAVSYDYKNLVYSFNCTESMPEFMKDEAFFRTSVKLMLLTNYSVLGNASDVMTLLAILEEENVNVEYLFNYPGISKRFVVSPNEILNVMTMNFKESEKRDFVDWFTKYMEYGDEAENVKGKYFYNERTKTIDVEYSNEEWSDVTIMLFELSFKETDPQEDLIASFDQLFWGQGRKMMRFFYDCGVHAVNIRYTNGNKSASIPCSLQGSTACSGERVYEF